MCEPSMVKTSIQLLRLAGCLRLACHSVKDAAFVVAKCGPLAAVGCRICAKYVI